MNTDDHTDAEWRALTRALFGRPTEQTEADDELPPTPETTDDAEHQTIARLFHTKGETQ